MGGFAPLVPPRPPTGAPHKPQEQSLRVTQTMFTGLSVPHVSASSAQQSDRLEPHAAACSLVRRNSSASQRPCSVRDYLTTRRALRGIPSPAPPSLFAGAPRGRRGGGGRAAPAVAGRGACVGGATAAQPRCRRPSARDRPAARWPLPPALGKQRPPPFELRRPPARDPERPRADGAVRLGRRARPPRAAARAGQAAAAAVRPRRGAPPAVPRPRLRGQG
jgi:hypothetical protein